MELTWCTAAIYICAPSMIVKIPKIICKIIKNPKILTDLYNLVILFLYTLKNIKT